MIAKRPIASVKAKPKIVICIKRGSNCGFLQRAFNKPAKTKPIPAPAPITPDVAIPAPINLAAEVNATTIEVSIEENLLISKKNVIIILI